MGEQQCIGIGAETASQAIIAGGEVGDSEGVVEQDIMGELHWPQQPAVHPDLGHGSRHQYPVGQQGVQHIGCGRVAGQDRLSGDGQFAGRDRGLTPLGDEGASLRAVRMPAHTVLPVAAQQIQTAVDGLEVGGHHTFQEQLGGQTQVERISQQVLDLLLGGGFQLG
jgi:hypothetical protein